LKAADRKHHLDDATVTRNIVEISNIGIDSTNQYRSQLLNSQSNSTINFNSAQSQRYLDKMTVGRSSKKVTDRFVKYPYP
jgi:hypothetical protein